ncbi:YbaB/EbfC family nucleoid-associated protein [Nocardia sp. NBC_00565]|uniref:YbaB/EbfC family nucleoid-associated protein n=1 Tax=Nocardia sp. NBC_00565 TaxID=2975993 RepID=UPI002E81F70E|nr:YbaB/EbfC family nucleoid-associated protein [Nocardia sp. NBC_00565]WUC04308.1 YbaB/EbfC family nucleoid-associated protein [Nocardia sp. NBC_00565]
MAEDTEELAARIKRINEATEQVRGRARSADGAVYIETDARGAITDLRLAPHAVEHGMNRLAMLIADRHRAAFANAEAEAQQIFTELSQEQPRLDGRSGDTRRERAPIWGSEQSAAPPTYVPTHRRGDSGTGRSSFGDHKYVV